MFINAEIVTFVIIATDAMKMIITTIAIIDAVIAIIIDFDSITSVAGSG